LSEFILYNYCEITKIHSNDIDTEWFPTL